MDARSREATASSLRATAGEQGWSPWRLAQAIREQAGTQTLLMAWRLAAGQTQSEVTAGLRGLAADRGTPCAPAPSNQQLSRWENGHEAPGSFYRPLLGLWYRTTLGRLGLADDDPVVTLESCAADPAAEEGNVERRQFLHLAVAAPVIAGLDGTRHRMNADLRHVLPPDEISRWQDIADSHVAQYGRRAPARLLDSLSPDMAELADLTSQYPRERDLSLVASQMCGLTGALHTDLGNERESRDWLHTASRYAGLSGETSQQYWVTAAQAMSALYGSQPDQAVSIAGRARARLGDHSCVQAAQLAGLAARAHSAVGQGDAARAELSRSEDIFSRARPDDGWFGFPERELRMYQSGVLSHIGDPGAWDAQGRALGAYPDDDPMDRPLIHLERARYLARHAHDADAAVQTAVQAIAGLRPAMRVPLLITQAESVAPFIAVLSPGTAGQYREELSGLVAQ